MSDISCSSLGMYSFAVGRGISLKVYCIKILHVFVKSGGVLYILPLAHGTIVNP